MKLCFNMNRRANRRCAVDVGGFINGNNMRPYLPLVVIESN
jgi:hypothetical protein